MPIARPMQSTFTSGVVDPALKARLDIQHYYDGILVGDNVDIKPQGGAKVRGGLRYIDTALELNARLIPFTFNRANQYLLEFSNLRIRIFKDGVLQTSINGTGNDYLVTTLTTAQVDALDFTQSYNTMILFHEDLQPLLLFRDGSDTAWTIGPITFENIPQFDYDDTSSPAPTTHDIRITFGGAWVAGNHYKLELNNNETPEIVYSSSTTANARRIAEELLKLPPTGFRSSGITVTYISGTIYQIQFSGDSADDYEPMTGFSIDVDSNTITETTRTTVGVSRREDAISTARGWPKCGAFYEGRLWMGGPKSLPQNELVSVVNDFFSLKVGEGFDDEAIFQALDTDQYNGIEFMHPGRNMQVFTAGGEFFHPAQPVTPADSGRPRQTRYGVSTAKPTEIDGASIFVTRSAKTVREFLFSQLEQSYNAGSLSLLAADPLLTSGIVYMDSLSGSDVDEASYVYCVTGDGNCAVLNTLRAQDIAAWSRYTTDGDIKRVVALDASVFFVVHRTINGVETAYIEQLDASLRMDSAITGTQAASKTISGLSHLEGKTVRVLSDGFLVDSPVVVGGAVTISRSTTSYQIGLDYNPDIRSLPLNVDLGDGPLIGLTKSVPDLYVLVKDTNGLIVAFDLTDEEGEALQEQVDPNWQLGQDQMDTVPTTVSGVRAFNFSGSTEKDAIIRIFQRDPLPFHVLGFVATIDIGGE